MIDPPAGFAALMTATKAEAAKAYASAVAADIVQKPDPDAWDRLRRIMARALVLTSLHGLASAWAGHGADIEKTTDEDMDALKTLNFGAPALTLGGIKPGPFLEAIRVFDGRVPAIRSTVERLWERSDRLASAIVRAESAEAVQRLASQSVGVSKAIRGAFWATDMDVDTADRVREIVAKGIRGFVDVDEAGKMIGRGVAETINAAQLAGAGNLTRARIETVLNNNVSSAFNEARVRGLSDPRARVFVPLVMLVEVQDKRTRGNPSGLYPKAGPHYQMNGFVGTTEQLNELGIVPPNGHNCRAAVRGVTLAEAVRKGWMTEDGELIQSVITAHNGGRLALIGRGLYPDPGFRTAPVALGAVA